MTAGIQGNNRRQEMFWANWGVCELPEESSCCYSTLAKSYQEHRQSAILHETKVSFKNEGKVNRVSDEIKLR